MKPLVSVVTITYNHEPWIGKCIEGVLAQKVNFPIEHIIAEDCSTDGTRAVCEKYEAEHPDIIRLLPSERNWGVKENEKRAMMAVRGKYIAFLEGDDYWTDPLKLQKQVDFLESHPDYSVCFTRWTNIDAETGEAGKDRCSDLFTDNMPGMDIDLDLYFKRWCTQPLTMLYRADAISISLYDKYKYYRDMHQIYHLLKAGKGYLFNFNGGNRTVHTGGIAGLISELKYLQISIPMDGEFYHKEKSKWTKANYVSTLDSAFEYHIKQNERLKAFEFAIRRFAVKSSPKRLRDMLRKIITSK